MDETAAWRELADAVDAALWRYAEAVTGHALDLMARWAPIAQTAALTALVEDLIAFDHRHNPARADGLLESVVRRVGRALPFLKPGKRAGPLTGQA